MKKGYVKTIEKFIECCLAKISCKFATFPKLFDAEVDEQKYKKNKFKNLPDLISFERITCTTFETISSVIFTRSIGFIKHILFK